jgi:hypothetical protein
LFGGFGVWVWVAASTHAVAGECAFAFDFGLEWLVFGPLVVQKMALGDVGTVVAVVSGRVPEDRGDESISVLG